MTSDEDAQAFVVASRALTGIATRAILAAPRDVTLSQQRLMVMLATKGPLNLSEIAFELGIDLSNASRLCDRLQRHGLVERNRRVDDGRVVEVSITNDGMEHIATVDDIRREEVKKVLASMTHDEVQDAVRALKIFAARAGEVQRRWISK